MPNSKQKALMEEVTCHVMAWEQLSWFYMCMVYFEHEDLK